MKRQRIVGRIRGALKRNHALGASSGRKYEPGASQMPLERGCLRRASPADGSIGRRAHRNNRSRR